jgi:hypothetical protein
MNGKLTDSSPIPFGKYKGRKMKTIPASYLDWMRGQPWIDEWPMVLDYINRNSDVIDQELKDAEYERGFE